MYIFNGLQLGDGGGGTGSPGTFLTNEYRETPTSTWQFPTAIEATVSGITANGVDTYLIGVGASGIISGSIITFRGCVTKTAAGTATPIFNVRFGNLATTSDTAIHTFTCVAQTAAADTGYFEIRLVIRSKSTTATSHGVLRFEHFNTTTGLANKAQVQLIQNTSGTYDNTVDNLKVGLSVNPGASGVWTFQHVIATIEKLNY